jgi:hypothetical protein
MTVTISGTRIIGGALVHVAAGAAAILFACAAAAQSVPQLGMAPAQSAPPLSVAPPTESQPLPTQPPPPQPQSAQPQPTQAQPPAKPPGVFAAMGRWLDDSIATMNSNWRNARTAVGDLGNQASDAAKDAAGAARDAAATMMRLPATSLVSGREHCVRAANGGPDCVAAAEALCKAKGYTTGTSLHIQSEQKCPVWGWIAGEKPIGRCSPETYVTSAMCR